MFDTYKMQENVCKELEKKSEAGIKSTADLDTIWKLAGTYKDLLKIDMLQGGSEYSHEDGYGMAGGYSERRKRDSRGRYSRESGYSREGEGYSRDGNYSEAYERGSSYRDGRRYSNDGDMKRDRYVESKHAYRSSKSPECKQRLMNTLEEYMDDFSLQMEEMLRDSDCREERDTIKRYLEKIKAIT